MTNENTTTTASAATFSQFLIKKNETNDEIGNFHLALGDRGFEFPENASALIEALSVNASSDGELQWNAEVVASVMRQAGDYILMALVEYQKMQQEAA